MVHVHFEFHCTSVDNERGIASGHHDPDLSPAGEQQAIELGERYRDRPVSAVYCSDLLRARKTAELAFEPLGVPINADGRLRECNYGDLNGQPRDDVLGNRSRYATEPYPNGESWTDAARRTLDLIDEIKRVHDGESVVIVGHSATFHALESLRTGRSLEALLAEPWQWKANWNWEADF